MKITDIRCYVVEDDHPAVPFRWRKGLPGSGDGTSPDRRPLAAILRMDTDEGITGAIKIGDGESVASLTRRRLKSFIGEDPLMIERLWTKMWEIDRLEETRMDHLGLIDLMLWDIKSRKAGLPAYALMGGNEVRVQAYASTVTWDTIEEYERHIKECSDEGFTAFKLHAWGDWREDARLVPQPAQMDGRRRDPDVRRLRRLGPGDGAALRPGARGMGFHWYEEPMREFDLTSYRKLAEASTFRCWPPRPRMACTGTPRPGSTWARSTWCALRVSTKAV